MTSRLVGIEIDAPTASAERSAIDEERKVAVRDLVEDNRLHPVDVEGDFRLAIAATTERLHIDIIGSDGGRQRLDLPLLPLKTVIRDYFMICESYRNALRGGRRDQIEAIDMGRRGIHNEGADILREQLGARVEADHETARRLFTLVCAVQLRTGQ